MNDGRTNGGACVPEHKEPLCNLYRVQIDAGSLHRNHAYSRKDFNEMYSYREYPKPSLGERLKKQRDKINIVKIFVSIFPILQWLPKYKWHTDLVHDLISGLTVAIMQIPQGLAYSILGGVPPVVGIYMAFFPVLIYAIMGTSRQLSMGAFSIILMLASKSVAEFSNESTGYSSVEVATALCLVVGFWQIVLGVMRLGSLSVILSEHLISGLVTGTAILVIASQLKHVFGMNLSKHNGSLQLIYIISDVFNNLSLTNYVALCTTITVVILLLSYQEYFKDRVGKKFPIPIPTELILIVSASLLSKYFDLSKKFSLSTVGRIPTGFPPPRIPPFGLLPQLAVDGFVIAVISFSIEISMATIFAEKHQYRVNANQELLASGAANVISSFFSCAPFGVSLSRSVIQDQAGGRTQLASIISCAFLTLVILYIGPFFEPLPHCVLAGIIFAAMKGMLVNVGDFFVAWKHSKIDGTIWLVTFCSVILIDIDIGLCVGVISSLLYITVQGQKIKIETLGNIPKTDIYVPIHKYQSAEIIPSVLILHIVAGMNFANKENVQHGIYKRLKSCDIKTSHLVLDFSAVSHIDPSSAKCLLQIYDNLRKRNIDLHLAKCSTSVYKVLIRCQFFDTFPDDHLYPSVHEAILKIQYS